MATLLWSNSNSLYGGTCSHSHNSACDEQMANDTTTACVILGSCLPVFVQFRSVICLFAACFLWLSHGFHCLFHSNSFCLLFFFSWFFFLFSCFHWKLAAIVLVCMWDISEKAKILIGMQDNNKMSFCFMSFQPVYIQSRQLLDFSNNTDPQRSTCDMRYSASGGISATITALSNMSLADTCGNKPSSDTARNVFIPLDVPPSPMIGPALHSEFELPFFCDLDCDIVNTSQFHI